MYCGTDQAFVDAIMTPKESSSEESSPQRNILMSKKVTLYAIIKLFLVMMIFTFGTMATYAIIAAATKEPITLIGLGLMGLVVASTYIKN